MCPPDFPHVSGCCPIQEPLDCGSAAATNRKAWWPSKTARAYFLGEFYDELNIYTQFMRGLA